MVLSPNNVVKREFLLSLQEQQPLSKQTVDAIMAENGRDIQATRALFSDYDAIKEELASAKQVIAQLETDNESAWAEKLAQMEERHRQQLQQVEFSYLFRQAVAQAGGRNEKAVAAMVDLEALSKGDDPQKALADALTALKKEEPWLFLSQTPPPYAAHTGAQSPRKNEPATLAGALRERFERK